MSALQEQKEMHKQAFGLISQALDLDPHAPTQALSFYRRGLQVMRQSLALQFSPAERQEASILESKMRRNMDMVQQRLAHLEGREVASSTTPPARAPAPSSHDTPPQVIDLTGEGPRSPSVSAGATGVNRGQDYHTSPPVPRDTPYTPSTTLPRSNGGQGASTGAGASAQYPELRGIDVAMQKLIMREIVDNSPGVHWDDIVGQQMAKQSLFETVILPSLRPELFTGLRAPSPGLLLFGPPGNGKTLLAKAVATECKGTFFSISASSLVSKWVGESEKLVRALFAIAKLLSPSIISIDEIDSMLGQRSSDESDASRRLKTEFLVQLDGVSSASSGRIFVLAMTNRPWDLDDAVLRRLGKRIFIGLPGVEERTAMIETLLRKQQGHTMSSRDVRQVVQATEGFSGSDLTMLCRDASMGPIRELGMNVRHVPTEQIRPVCMRDFLSSLSEIRPSASPDNLRALLQWNETYGSSTRTST